MSRIAIVSLLFIVLFIVFVVAGTLSDRQMSCEVCVAYKGGSKCRTVVGDDREETIRLATDNACAFLASGRTQLIQCSNTPPTRVQCTDK